MKSNDGSISDRVTEIDEYTGTDPGITLFAIGITAMGFFAFGLAVKSMAVTGELTSEQFWCGGCGLFAVLGMALFWEHEWVGPLQTEVIAAVAKEDWCSEAANILCKAAQKRGDLNRRDLREAIAIQERHEHQIARAAQTAQYYADRQAALELLKNSRQVV